MLTTLLRLASSSLLNRRGTVLLTLVAVSVSVAMLLAVERVRTDVRDGFARTLSGTDLIVGARGGAVQLLLYSVFHVGDATANVSWQSFQAIAGLPQVAWAVPISLGDTHRGRRVMGTERAFFDHYRHGRDVALRFEDGRPFAALFEAVIGAELARSLGYAVGQQIVVSHGTEGLASHDDKPFTIVGVLAPTGTPIDRTVLVSLEAIEAIHVDWSSGGRIPGVSIPADKVQRFDLTPKSVTAVLVGLKSRTTVFQVQRFVNRYPAEPLTAIMPGVTLQALWDVVGVVERALLLVSALVVVVGITGLVAVLLAGLDARRRELAILRALGARPGHVFVLLACEGLLLGVAGCALGLGAVQLGLGVAGPWLEAHYGIALGTGWPSASEWALLGLVIASLGCASLIPAWRAYRYAVADGMTVRI